MRKSPPSVRLTKSERRALAANVTAAVERQSGRPVTLKILAYQKGFDGIRGLAQAAGISPGTLGAVCSGHRNLGYAKLMKVCATLGVTEEEFHAAIQAGAPKATINDDVA